VTSHVSLDARGRSSRPPPRILVVGAGAVGRVYGTHLQRGGAHVDVFVRPHRVDEAHEGWPMSRIGWLGARTASRFVPDGVVTEASRRWDQVWLCVSTDALVRGVEDGSFVPLLQAGDRLVVLQPGLHVPDLLAPHVGAVIDGGIDLVSYDAPLPGEDADRATAYFVPGPSPFTGEGAAAVVRLLRDGGLPAREVPDARARMAFATSALMPTIVALEGAGWKLPALRGEWARLAAGAGREAWNVTALRFDPPLGGSPVRPWMLTLGGRLAPTFAPFPVETYLQIHFTKVRPQSEALIERYLRDGVAGGVKVDALAELHRRVFMEDGRPDR